MAARLDCTRSELADLLAHAHAALAGRADATPALRARLTPEAPRPVPAGYGLLPALIPNATLRRIPLTESRFSLEALSGAAAADRDAAARLAERAGSAADPLEPLVGEFERLRGRLRYLDANLGYHRYWQKAAAESPAFFAGKNRLVAEARAVQALERAGTDSAAAAERRRALARAVAPFRKTAGLAWRQEADGSRTLPVTVVTDIEDSVFLERFAEGVRAAWSESEAARARRFRVELQVVRIAPSRLYPEGAPALGREVDEARHVARFPAAALVLTTGARSLHAWQGHYIQLATSPISPATLAHEFGHLLGFDDGYLRGTEGDPDGPFGVTLVEWTGIQDDLMGAPGVGRVTEELIDQLVSAYSPAPGPASRIPTGGSAAGRPPIE